MSKKKPTPVPLGERVRASEARKLKAGGRRIPGGILPPDAAAALELLTAEQYATTASGCIFRALIEAAERVKPASGY